MTHDMLSYPRTNLHTLTLTHVVLNLQINIFCSYMIGKMRPLVHNQNVTPYAISEKKWDIKVNTIPVSLPIQKSQ